MTIPVNVVMAQELAPTQRGVVTSLMMGFAWGIAGIVFIPLVGWIADRTGIEAVLYGVSLLPLFGYALSLALPREGTAAGH
jgi:FSR family fosmidomycin resistance protein-like MFS transporter